MFRQSEQSNIFDFICDYYPWVIPSLGYPRELVFILDDCQGILSYHPSNCDPLQIHFEHFEGINTRECVGLFLAIE